MRPQALIFDAYGTLFDVYAMSAVAEKRFPGNGAKLAALWRDKQIQYTQLRTMCATYKPFWELTQDALLFSCKKLGLELDLAAQTTLMGQYAKLPVYEEVAAALEKLHAQGFKLAILSNANSQMLETCVDAAGLRGLFHHILSVDAVKKFKTAPEAYQLAPDVFGYSARSMLFVSGNCWDVCGAAWFGYSTYWVNRYHDPIEELGVTPNGKGQDLLTLLDFL